MCVRELILRIFDAKVELLSIFRVLSIAQAIILCITIPALICALLISNKAHMQGKRLWSIINMKHGCRRRPVPVRLGASQFARWALQPTGNVTIRVVY